MIFIFYILVNIFSKRQTIQIYYFKWYFHANYYNDYIFSFSLAFPGDYAAIAYKWTVNDNNNTLQK